MKIRCLYSPLLALCLVALHSPLLSASPAACPDKLIQLSQVEESLWKLNRAIEVPVSARKMRPLQFSYDAEITHAEVINSLRKEPKLFKKLEELVETATFDKSKSRGLGLSLEELSEVLELSPAQVKAFHIHASAKKKKSFRVTDLNPKAFHVYFDELLINVVDSDDLAELTGHSLTYAKAQKLLDGTIKLVDQVLKKEGMNAKATQDIRYVELVFNGSEKTPSEFASQLSEKLWKKYPTASAHLHIGIPAELEEKTLLAISRAVETRIILRLAQIPPTSEADKLAYTYFSTLTKKPALHFDRDYVNARGVVKVSKDRFSKPFSAHDLEIRQYGRHKEGLADLELAARLTQDHKKLKLQGAQGALPKTGTWEDDEYTANLYGALKYTAWILENDSRKEVKSLIGKLNTLTKAIEKNGYEITQAHRKKAADILEDVNVEELLPAEAFLK